MEEVDIAHSLEPDPVSSPQPNNSLFHSSPGVSRFKQPNHHQRTSSEPILALKKGLSRLPEVILVEQTKEQEVMSLSKEESNIMVDQEGNLRDELGFLLGGNISGNSPSVGSPAYRRSTITELDSLPPPPPTSGLNPSSIGEIQRKAWEDFFSSIGGNIQVLTRAELQRWRKFEKAPSSSAIFLSPSSLTPAVLNAPESNSQRLPNNSNSSRFRRLFASSTVPKESRKPRSSSASSSFKNSFKFQSRKNQLTTLIRLHGIPTELRAQVWIACCGSDEKQRLATPEEQYDYLCTNISSISPFSTQIENDLHRTFPTNYVFQNDEGIAGLRSVLLAYSIRNKEVGYCQSMNFLVATLLLHMNETQAFWVLAAIVEDLLPGYFTPELVGVHVDQRTFVALVKTRFPKVSAHLDKLQFPLALVAYQWFLCIFVNALPLGSTLRVWDSFLHEGPKILFRVGLAIIRSLSRDLLLAESFSDAYEVLTDGTKNRERFSGTRLLRSAFDPIFFASFSGNMLHELRARQLIVVRRELNLDDTNKIRKPATPLIVAAKLDPPVLPQPENGESQPPQQAFSWGFSQRGPSVAASPLLSSKRKQSHSGTLRSNSSLEIKRRTDSLEHVSFKKRSFSLNEVPCDGDVLEPLMLTPVKPLEPQQQQSQPLQSSGDAQSPTLQSESGKKELHNDSEAFSTLDSNRDDSDQETIWLSSSDEEEDNEDEEEVGKEEAYPKELGPPLSPPDDGSPMDNFSEEKDFDLEEADDLPKQAHIPTIELPTEYLPRFRSLSFVMNAKPSSSSNSTGGGGGGSNGNIATGLSAGNMFDSRLPQVPEEEMSELLFRLAQVPEEEMMDLHEILATFAGDEEDLSLHRPAAPSSFKAAGAADTLPSREVPEAILPKMLQSRKKRKRKWWSLLGSCSSGGH